MKYMKNGRLKIKSNYTFSKKRHKCRNCGRIRLEKFMQPFIGLEHGIEVSHLYPEQNKKKQYGWECGDCEENLKNYQKI